MWRPGKRWASLQQAVFDLLFPPRCVACNGEMEPPVGLPLCAGCRETLAPKGGARCPRCAAERPPTNQGTDCLQCRDRTFAFDGAVALGPYHGALRRAVLAVKHPGGIPLAMALGELLSGVHAERLAEQKVDVIVPVPMHWRRRIVRGANGPDVIAERLARRLGGELLTEALVRCRNTRLQGELPLSARTANVRGAFRVRKGYDFHDARVLLVDDVLTTGATLTAAARQLKRAGAAGVLAAVLARAQRSM